MEKWMSKRPVLIIFNCLWNKDGLRQAASNEIIDIRNASPGGTQRAENDKKGVAFQLNRA